VAEATQVSFGTDLGRALAAWRRLPWLPAVSVAIGATFHLPDKLWPLVLVILALQAGWVGTERICYLRAFRGKPIRAAELWRLTRAFVIRYCALAMAVGIPLIVVLTVLSLTGVLAGVSSEGSLGPSLIVLYAFSVVVDVALTFVTPALAFTTRKVRHGLRIGLGMIRQEWPSSAWYVLVPPLAALFVFQTLTRLREVGFGGQMVLSALATLLNLWFKGATAAFYLRRNDVGDDGAAFIPRDTSGRRLSTAGHEEGLFLPEDEAEDLGRIRDLGAILEGIGRLIPEGGTLYLEGTSIAPDVAEFLERNQAERTVPVAKGTIWPKPRTFHIPLTGTNILQLAEMERQHAAPEICDHLVVYRDEEVLLTAYDAGSGSVYLSQRLPQGQLEELRRLVRDSR
jgi:hypothetical protein